MEKTSTRILITIAVIGIVAIDGLYVAIARMQGDAPPDVLTVPFVASYLALMATLLGSSLFLPLPARAVVRAAASCGLVVLGLIALFSIGVLILVIAGLAIAASVASLEPYSSRRVLATTAVVSVLGVVVLIGGLQATARFLVCPPTGSSGGTTGGIFGQLTYECNEGQLTTR